MGEPKSVTTSTSALRQIFRDIMALDHGQADRARLLRIRRLCPGVEEWRALLSAIPLDKLSFQLEVGVQRDAAIEALADWCPEFGTGFETGFGTGFETAGSDDRIHTETHGYLSILLITLITMSDGAAAGSHDCERLCGKLMDGAGVGDALLALYAPTSDECPAGSQRAEEWGRVTETTLQFHRHGSTSFIVSGVTRQSQGRRAKFALKCVLFPYSNVPVIANKTRTYADDHNSMDVDGRPVEHMVGVWASTSRWILMDFARGNTLAEEIERVKSTPPRRAVRYRGAPSMAGSVRLDLLRRLGMPLLTALAELHARGKHHEDLSPTNIIVWRRDPSEGGPEYDLTFIDFGRNYLHVGAMGGHEDTQADFAAPEVRNNAEDVARADLYSLGRLLIRLGDVGVNRDGTIPDPFYSQAPLVARLIEDLIDERPDRRLLVFNTTWTSDNVYLALRRILEQELDVTQAELVHNAESRYTAIPSDRQSLAALFSIIPPSREPRKRRRVYRLRREQGTLNDPRRSMYARWLLSFSVASSIVYVLTFGASAYWFLRDIGVGITNPADEIVLRLIGGNPNFLPVIDNLRHADYHIGDLGQNFPARLIGLTFAMAGVRYYQNILGGLTTRVAHSPALPGLPLRIGTEFAIRVMAVWPLWLILGANLVEVRWWPLCSAIGYSWVIPCNVLTARCATKYLKLARQRGLSTVPPEHQKLNGLESFKQWAPTISLYSMVVWVLAIFIQIGVLHDVYVYALFVAVVNVGLLYVIKTGTDAPNIRTGLNRCFFAAERLRYEAELR